MKKLLFTIGLLMLSGCEIHTRPAMPVHHGVVTVSTHHNTCYDYDVPPYYEPFDCYGGCCTWEEDSSMGHIAFCDVTYCIDSYCDEWYVADEVCYSY